MPMAASGNPGRHASAASRVLFFCVLMACGYLLLYIALPPRRSEGVPPDADLARTIRQRVCSGVDIQPGRWRSVVIHHSATLGGNAARFDDYHRFERHWEGGLGYHFVIGNGNGSDDGEVEVGHRWLRQETGAHVRDHNVGAVGICLVGDFETHLPTDRQMQALTCLVRCLMDVCGLTPDDVTLHRELGNTKCPGALFPAEAFRVRLADRGDTCEGD